MKTTIVIPTYNEADNLAAMVDSLFQLPLDDVNLIVVDDNSPDGTGRLADQLAAARDGRLQVIHRPAKGGLGTAYAAGFSRALDDGADIIVQMDADFSHSPAYIPDMIAQLGEVDVVVGSRYAPGGSVDERWSWWRYFLSWWANRIYSRVILGLPVLDATAGFKVFRRDVLAAIDLSHIISNGYVFQIEIAYLCDKLGFQTLEWPIYFEDRRIGKSKMDVPVKVEAVWRVWQIRWRYRNVRAITAVTSS